MAETSRSTSDHARDWRVPLAVAGLVVVAVAIRLPNLDAPLLGTHGFRETQTAYTAVLYRDEGLSLLHPRLPVLGAPFEVPFEFPAFQALAGAVMWLGVPADAAMRLTGIACFAATALLLFGFVRRFADTLAALVALGVFLFSPFALLWSRASLIEYLATAAAVGYLWAGLEWRERRSASLAVVAVLVGSLAFTVKITTAVIFVVPLLTYVATSDRPGLRNAVRARLAPPFLALLLVPLAAGLLWTRHADAIKEAHELTRWLTSDALRDWNLGTLDQRTERWRWVELVRRMGRDHLGVVLLPLFVAGLLQSRRRSLWLGWAAAGAAAVLVFFNLHVVHDYYQAALTPISAAVAGVGASALFRHPLLARFRSPVAITAVVGLLVAVGVAHDHYFWERAWRDTPPSDARLAMARSIEANTLPGERVAVIGLDWSPEVLYYARRKGIMFTDGVTTATTLAAIDGSYRLLAVAPAVPAPLRDEVLRHWRSVREVEPGIYRVAQPAS
jgi:hypothetical protein